jgi:hypothetical protein
MLNSGKKINIPILVLSEKNFLNETKNHNPPFKLKRQISTCMQKIDVSIFYTSFYIHVYGREMFQQIIIFRAEFWV